MKKHEQLYSQNKIADILGVSKSTLSKWLKANAVSPKQLKGQRKYYDKTVIERYQKSKKVDTKRENHLINSLTVFQTVSEKQHEIDELKQLLKDKEEQLKEKDEQIMLQNNELVELAKKFAQLADQAQQLNLVDKPLRQKKFIDKPAENSKVLKSKLHWWQKIGKTKS